MTIPIDRVRSWAITGLCLGATEAENARRIQELARMVLELKGEPPVSKDEEAKATLFYEAAARLPGFTYHAHYPKWEHSGNAGPWIHLAIPGEGSASWRFAVTDASLEDPHFQWLAMHWLVQQDVKPTFESSCKLRILQGNTPCTITDKTMGHCLARAILEVETI